MLQLSRGDDSLILAPEFGGSIVGWTRRGTQMFRRASPEAVMLGRPNAMGCFPQVPFCNRIAWRRFNWAGQTYELAANFGDRPHAIHGVGWQRPRRIQETLSHSTGCGFPMLSGLASRNNQAKTLGLPRRCDDFVILWVGVRSFIIPKACGVSALSAPSLFDIGCLFDASRSGAG